MLEYLEINTDKTEAPRESDGIIESRGNAARSFLQSEPDLSIALISYNRLEKTKTCVESLLKHTHMPFRLLLIDSGSDPDILDYYRAVPHQDKQIIRITRNISANHAFWVAIQHLESRFCAIVSNDIVVTPHAIENLYRCITSSDDIGWVSPVSSNISNWQQVDLEFETLGEMFEKAEQYNRSDPLKWHERSALMPAIMLYRKECMDITGGFDYGFSHDFADDDMARRFNRAGYKTILCRDTWVHHDHNYYNMDAQQRERSMASLKSGRERFRQKYHGLDAWDDMRNFEHPLIGRIKRPGQKESASILGVDVRTGVPVLEIRNRLREFGVIQTESRAFTTHAKYYADLQTVCATVHCDRIEFIGEYFNAESFDYIILGEPVNSYAKPFELIEKMYGFLKPGGTLLFKLKNTSNYGNLMYFLGEYQAKSPEKPVFCITAESVVTYLTQLGVPSPSATLGYNRTPQQQEIDMVSLLIDALPHSKDSRDMAMRLLAQDYLFLAEKPAAPV